MLGNLFFRSILRSRLAGVFVALTIFFGVGVTLPVAVHAQTAASLKNASIVAEAAGVPQVNLVTLIGRIINIALGFLGTVFLILILYAGYIWMTAAGDAAQVQKAKDIIRNAIIGIVIVASAFAITNFIFGLLAGDQGGLGGGSNKGGKGGGLSLSSGSLGGGILESHLPSRNATEVARNTPIIVTFKEAIDPASFIANWTDATSGTVDGLNAANILVYPTAEGEAAALTSDKAHVKYLKNLKTFVIRPVDYLGSAVKKVPYTVVLKGGTGGIKKKDGSAAFNGPFGSGYNWQFEVSTVIDLTAPQVVNVVPEAGGKYDRNIVIQINFNRPMDPTSVSGKVADGFTNIQVLSTPKGGLNQVPVDGEFVVSNEYRTVEFVSTEKCGTNSCGQDVYCLPGDAAEQVLAKAATLINPDSPQAEFTSNGFNGVVSVTSNSLDGNKSGKAEGPPADNYAWEFGTSNDIKLSPPRIEKTVPNSDPQLGENSNIPLDQKVQASYDTRLRSSSLNSDNAYIEAHGKDEVNPDTFWWSVSMMILNEAGDPYDASKQPAQVPSKSALVISHRPYLPSGDDLKSLNFYDPYILHGVQDVYQNCFNPSAKCGTKDVPDMISQGPNCCNSAASKTGCKPLFNP